MAIRFVRAVLDHEIRPPGRKLVLLALAERADQDGHCYPSRAVLSKDTSMTRGMVRQHVNALLAEGWLTSTVTRSGTTYHLDASRLGGQAEPVATPATRRLRREPARDMLGADLEAYARLTPKL